MFRTVPLSFVRSFSLHTQQWYISYRFADSLLASCQQTCMIYTIAACAVKNSWRWTEELSETCRVLFQNKFQKLLHLVGFIVRICQMHHKLTVCVYSLANNQQSQLFRIFDSLTLILLTWRIGWTPNNASRWQMWFNSAFKWLNKYNH